MVGYLLIFQTIDCFMASVEPIYNQSSVNQVFAHRDILQSKGLPLILYHGNDRVCPALAKREGQTV